MSSMISLAKIVSGEVIRVIEDFISEPNYVDTKKKPRLPPLFLLLQNPAGAPDEILCFDQIHRSRMV